jgi:hypothetical protein
LKKTLHKKGLVEWLKVYKALSSNPSMEKKNPKNQLISISEHDTGTMLNLRCQIRRNVNS